MLSYAKIKSAGPAAAYFAKYYAIDSDRENGEPPGRWDGSAATSLGLTGEVKREELERVLRGEHPFFDQALGKVDKNHVAGHDLTFSAPKSVSTIWAVGDRDLRKRLEQAHENAVSAGIAYMRTHGIHCRLGKAGREIARAEPIIARFQHSTSRANDPQLHSHTVVVNRAIGPAGDWRSVEVDLRALHSAGSVYRAQLAQELARLGYGIERTNTRGEFEVAGVPRELMKHWSTRRGDVLAELREMEKSGAEAAAKAAAVSRRNKENPDRGENFERWKEEARKLEFDAAKAASLEKSRSRDNVPKVEANSAVDGPSDAPANDRELVARALGNRVALDSESLRREVLRDAVGRQTVVEALERSDRILASLERIEKNDARGRVIERFTTSELLERERAMMRDAADLAAAKHHALDGAAVEAAISRAKLSGQQAEMVRALTQQSGLANVQGWAGTGKTYTVRQVAELYRAAGYNVRGCAVAGRAAEELKEAGIADSCTIARLRIELDAGRVELQRSTVLIIDEAGMMGSLDASDVYRRAAASGAKVIQIGDTRQLAPVEAGAPFRDTLRAHGGIELSEVRRQIDQVDKEIARALREQRPEDARSMMLQRGQWHVTEKGSDAIREMVRAYAAERSEGRDSLLVASLRRDVERLNVEARAELRERGLIRGDDASIETKNGELRLAAGDRVMFTERVDAMKVVNGTRAEVTEARADALRLRFGDGREREIKLWRPEEMEAVQERLTAAEVRVAGLQEAKKRAVDFAKDGVSNATDVRAAWREVEHVKRELSAAQRDLRVAREEAKRARSEHGAARSLVHGHASTVHKSQGATVKGAEQGGGTVHALLRDNRLADSNAAYVAMSRNTGRAHAYVSRAEEHGALERLKAAARLDSLADYRESPANRGDFAAASATTVRAPAPEHAETPKSDSKEQSMADDKLRHFDVPGRRIELDPSAEINARVHSVALVDVDELCKRWEANDPKLYVTADDPRTANARRLEGARAWVREGQFGKPPVVGVMSDGGVSIVDGRHRIAALREAGAKQIPVAIDKTSLANAQRHGFVLAVQKSPERVQSDARVPAQPKEQSAIERPAYLSRNMAAELDAMRNSSDPRERHLADATDAWLSHASALREAALRYGDQKGVHDADQEARLAIRSHCESKREILGDREREQRLREPGLSAGHEAAPGAVQGRDDDGRGWHLR
jgi:conjugative relaxase-like TrwC/TraI family protein